MSFTIVSMQLNEPKRYLKKHGWTQRQAAAVLNVSESYLCRVLNGHMKSRRLLAAVLRLGNSPRPAKQQPYGGMD